MKKKGLIVATIVMVLVLAVSLTTATYAWFTVTSVTTIDAFSVSVSSGNAVNIGLKTNNTMVAGTAVDADQFKTGTVIYTPGTAGNLPLGTGNGSWDGTTGLGASLDHNIQWGAQSKAVGAVDLASNTKPTTASSYKNIGYAMNNAASNTWFINAANGDSTTLTNVSEAYTNIGAATATPDVYENGDYVYMLLGASPTKTLETNELIIMLDGSNSSGTQCGILSAIHVCYRVTKQGEAINTTWSDAAIFPAANAYNTPLTGLINNLTADEGETYKSSYSLANYPTSKAYCLKITGLSTAQGAIDQIEFFIYIDGTDGNCRNEATGASGSISIFFHTTDPTP